MNKIPFLAYFLSVVLISLKAVNKIIRLILNLFTVMVKGVYSLGKRVINFLHKNWLVLLICLSCGTGSYTLIMYMNINNALYIFLIRIFFCCICCSMISFYYKRWSIDKFLMALIFPFLNYLGVPNHILILLVDFFNEHPILLEFFFYIKLFFSSKYYLYCPNDIKVINSVNPNFPSSYGKSGLKLFNPVNTGVFCYRDMPILPESPAMHRLLQDDIRVDPSSVNRIPNKEFYTYDPSNTTINENKFFQACIINNCKLHICIFPGIWEMYLNDIRLKFLNYEFTKASDITLGEFAALSNLNVDTFAPCTGLKDGFLPIRAGKIRLVDLRGILTINNPQRKVLESLINDTLLHLADMGNTSGKDLITPITNLPIAWADGVNEVNCLIRNPVLTAVPDGISFNVEGCESTDDAITNNDAFANGFRNNGAFFNAGPTMTAVLADNAFDRARAKSIPISRTAIGISDIINHDN